MDDLDGLLNARGVSGMLGAYVTSVRFNLAGSHAGFALGDGSVRLYDFADWRAVPVHAGAVLALAADAGGGFCSGGDDGFLRRVGLDGSVVEIAGFGRKWVEHVAGWAGGKAPLLACAVGKVVVLFDAGGRELRRFLHASTVSGLAFDAKGKRLAVSHYNGASLWFTGSDAQTPKLLSWKGSHTGVAVHPEGAAVVTSMQENALHGWSLPEQKHMRMSGYPAKTESFGFTASGRWLATGGADALVLWPFFGGGPMGKAPVELAGGDGAMVRQLACHPVHEVVAVGFDNGMVAVVDIPRERTLPVCGPGRGAVSAIGWNASGSHLAFGTQEGFAAVVDFSAAP